jgi:predicted phosphodiesterase
VRIAVISDVHANLPTLRAVLADINAAAPDAVVSCGDLAAGPFPHPTIDLLRGLDIPVYCVRGNADRLRLGARLRLGRAGLAGWRASGQWRAVRSETRPAMARWVSS